MKRSVATVMALVFGVVSICGCVKPTSVSSAKSVVNKVVFYIGMAQTLVSVAKTHYKDNEKIKTSITATEKAMVAVQTTLFLVNAGLEKDYGLLGVRLTTLVSAIFDLTKAIREAKKATS